jgi:hypothetical protein
MIPAPRNNPDFNSHEWQDWFFRLSTLIGSGGGMASTTAIVNGYATNNFSPEAYGSQYVAKRVFSGSMSAGVEKQVFSVSGKGTIFLLGIASGTTFGKTATIRIVIDGTTVFNFTSNGTGFNSGSSGVYLIGNGDSTNSHNSSFCPVYFNKLFEVYITSSITEANGFVIDHMYSTNA